jgi:hypothetical protein
MAVRSSAITTAESKTDEEGSVLYFPSGFELKNLFSHLSQTVELTEKACRGWGDGRRYNTNDDIQTGIDYAGCFGTSSQEMITTTSC